MTTTLIHKSLHRPNLFMGGDRELVMFSGLLAFLVGFGGFTFYSAAAGIIFWLVALANIRRICKKDPLIRKVWMYYARQQAYYFARTSIWRRT